MKITHFHILVISGLLILASGCTFYKYTSETDQQEFKSTQVEDWEILDRSQHNAGNYYYEDGVYYTLRDGWSNLDYHNVIVVHDEGAVYEVVNLTFNSETKYFSGNTVPFDGYALKYYEKIVNQRDRIALRKSRSKIRSEIKQVHFFIHSDTNISSSNSSDSTIISTGNAITFSLDSIYQLDVTNPAPGLGILSAVGITAGATAVFLAIACNCPHVYLESENGLVLSNSLFTGSKAPQLERNDYKLLDDYYPTSSRLTFNISNEEAENQYTNLLELFVIEHDENVRVLADQNGDIYTIGQPVSPVVAVDNDFVDISKTLMTEDQSSYAFNPDRLDDLSNVYLRFDVPQGQQQAKLLLSLKNTEWSGYVYNSFNSLFGKNFTRWVEMNATKTKEEREKWMLDQGIQLIVEIRQGEGWTLIDEIDLVGDINFHTLVVPLEFAENLTTADIRIRSGFMFWELDYAAMDFSANAEVQKHVFNPVSVIKQDGLNYRDAVLFDDSVYLNHMEAESATVVTFEGLPVDQSLNRTIFLRGKGYYVSNKTYSGKTHRSELQQFLKPGELSRYSKSLLLDLTTKTAMN